MYRNRHLPSALAQRRLERLDDGEVAAEPGQAPFALQRLHEPAEIARRLVHVGLGDLDVMQAHGGIELDCDRLDRLAHDLAMDLALRRHVDDDVAHQPRRAGEAAAGEQRLPRRESCLGLAERRQVARRGDDAVLGELAYGDLDLAAAADAAAAADGIDVDAERAARLQERRAEREPAALPRRREDDERVSGLDGVGERVLRHGAAGSRGGRGRPRPRH